jgi:hypothetical protein
MSICIDNDDGGDVKMISVRRILGYVEMRNVFGDFAKKYIRNIHATCSK